jgi:hypothetical protein
MNKLSRASLLIIGASVACDSPMEPFRPAGQGELVPVNQLIEDAISGAVARNYSFEATAGAEYVVLLRSLHGVVMLGVSDPGTGYTLVTVASGPSSPALEDNPSASVFAAHDRTFLLDAGVLSGDTARFQFKIVPVNRTPEIAASGVALGDSVEGETINPLYDADIFTAHADSGQTIAALVQPLGSQAGGISVYQEGEIGQQLYLMSAAPGEPMLSSMPMTLPVSGDWRFVVRGTEWQGHPRHRGVYRFWTIVRDTAPEHVVPALPIQTVVTGERMDNPIDVDAFTFHDTVGAELVALVEGPHRFMVAVRSPTDSLIAVMTDQDNDTTLYHHGTQAFQLPATGTYKLRVESSWDAPWLATDTGPYRIMLFRLNRQPETVVAAVALGDTIRGEALNPAGDVDEFTVTAAPGSQHAAWFRVTSNAAPQYSAVTLDVIDPATAASLAQVTVGVALPFATTPTFTVPAGGSVRIRVAPISGGPGATAPYEFFVN